MKWKPKVIIAGACLLMSIALSCFGIDSFVKDVGLLAAGYLFGTTGVEEASRRVAREVKNNIEQK